MSLDYSELGAFRDGRIRLEASCEADLSCRHMGMLDVEMLIARFGEHFPLVRRRGEMLSHLVCTGCGRRGTAIIRLSPTNVPTMGRAHSWG